MMRQPPIAAEQLSSASPQPPGPSTDTKANQAAEPILCQHCGRTASNGISCQGMCVADSGY